MGEPQRRSLEERMAILENDIDTMQRVAVESRAEMKETIRRMEEKIDKLVQAANMGKGAWWIVLRFGGFLVGVAAFLAAMETAWRAFAGHGPH